MPKEYLDYLCGKYSCSPELLEAGMVTDSKTIFRDLKKKFKISKDEIADIKFDLGF